PVCPRRFSRSGSGTRPIPGLFEDGSLPHGSQSLQAAEPAASAITGCCARSAGHAPGGTGSRTRFLGCVARGIDGSSLAIARTNSKTNWSALRNRAAHEGRQRRHESVLRSNGRRAAPSIRPEVRLRRRSEAPAARAGEACPVSPGRRGPPPAEPEPAAVGTGAARARLPRLLPPCARTAQRVGTPPCL